MRKPWKIRSNATKHSSDAESERTTRSHVRPPPNHGPQQRPGARQQPPGSGHSPNSDITADSAPPAASRQLTLRRMNKRRLPGHSTSTARRSSGQSPATIASTGAASTLSDLTSPRSRSGGQVSTSPALWAGDQCQTELNRGHVASSGMTGGGSTSMQQSSGSSTDLSRNEIFMVNSAAYITDLSQDVVINCLQSLKRQGLELTHENMYNECEKVGLPRPSSGGREIPSFPRVVQQQTVQHEATGTDNSTTQASRPTPAPSEVAVSNVYTNQACPVENSTQASPPSRQDSMVLRNAAPVEDQVDGQCVTTHAANKEPKNHESKQHRKRKDIGSTKSSKPTNRDSSIVAPAASSTGASQSVGNFSAAVVSDRGAPSGAAVVSEGPSQDHQGASQGAHSEASVAASVRQPLDERDPAQQLATCLKLVQDEFEILDKARHCGECGSRPRDITFLPCGHAWACRSCAVPLYTCPCCGKSIIATVDTYLC